MLQITTASSASVATSNGVIPLNGFLSVHFLLASVAALSLNTGVQSLSVSFVRSRFCPVQDKATSADRLCRFMASILSLLKSLNHLDSFGPDRPTH